MKKRIVSLMIAAVMLVSAVALPSGAATANDVYACLKKDAMSGSLNANVGYYEDSVRINENPDIYFGIVYWTNTSSRYGDIDVSIWTDSFEVTLVIPKSPAPLIPPSLWFTTIFIRTDRSASARLITAVGSHPLKSSTVTPP